MKHEVTYEFIEENYPEAIEQMMASLEAGTSKEKGRPAQDLTWYISWGEKTPAMSGRQFFDRIKSGDLPTSDKPVSLDERVNQRLERLVGLSVEGKVGRWRTQVTIEGTPAFVEDIIRDQEEEKLEEERALEALTPEERQRRAAEALNQLRGSSGFMEFHVPTDAD